MSDYFIISYKIGKILISLRGTTSHSENQDLNSFWDENILFIYLLLLLLFFLNRKATNSPCKSLSCFQIVAEVLKKTSPNIRKRLQLFLMENPHPVPHQSAENANEDSKNDISPIFLLHQQSLINSFHYSIHKSQNSSSNSIKNLSCKSQSDENFDSKTSTGLPKSLSESSVKLYKSSCKRSRSEIEEDRYEAIENIIMSCLQSWQENKNIKSEISNYDEVKSKASALLSSIKDTKESCTPNKKMHLSSEGLTWN